MPAPTPEDIAKWHRWFAVELNNRSWELLEGESERAPAEDTEMLAAAYGAWFHWHQVGTAENFARAEHLVSRAHAELGHVELAGEAAQRCMTWVEAHGLGTWDAACAHEAVARAAALAGKADERERHLTSATELAAQLEADDQAYLEGVLQALPEAVTRR